MLRHAIAIVLFSLSTLFASDAPIVTESSQALVAAPTPAFIPDACSIQRFGPAYRYPQAGWIVLHIEGEPYERGVQHGRLLPNEIKEYIHCMAMCHSTKTPYESWNHLRTLCNSLFLRRFDKEYLEEMRGIADGANQAGAKVDGRNLDLIDVLVANVWAELMTLDGALDAWPTGLEGSDRFKQQRPKHERCSAFIATAPATADGKIVFGHITMYMLYPSSFFNVWLDVKPAKGHRIVMQSYPGGMQSGTDYYINDAGIMVCETTISQTKFDPNGMSNSSQIRKALQYGESIDQVVEYLKGGNGLYTNEWLIGDAKTNEIAMLEQGTHTSKLYRSSKGEWFGNTPGFYWGCNNTKDLAVRLETVNNIKDRPLNLIYRPHDRDTVWVNLYEKYKGRIDANFGREAFTTPPLASYTSVDAKVATSDMAKDLKTLAIFGPPMGKSWQPANWEREKFPAVRPMMSNPWVTLDIEAVNRSIQAVKQPPPLATDLGGLRRQDPTSGDGASKPSWHGTLFPKSDADYWLPIAFSDYERFYSREAVQIDRAKDHCLCDADKRQSSRDLFSTRANYLLAARDGDTALKDIKFSAGSENWYHIAAGKGFLLLHELRSLVGDKAFVSAMDSFGTANAGKEVSSGEFIAHFEKSTGKELKNFFERWLTQTGLPRVRIQDARVVHADKKSIVEATLSAENGRWPAFLDVTLEVKDGAPIQKTLQPEGATWTLKLESEKKPVRLVIDKFDRSALANGTVLTLGTFMRDLPHTIIVYGTSDEVSANTEAAQELQTALIKRGYNLTVPIRSDLEVTENELSRNHVLLVGKPTTNRISKRFAKEFPISFGTTSFTTGGETYGHPASAVAAAAVNPLAPRYSIVMIAGLSAASTYAVAPRIGYGEARGEVCIFENGGGVHSRISPPAELQRKFE